MRRRPRLPDFLVLALAALPLLTASSASADGDEAGKKIATDLFDQGVKLMTSKHCDEVVPSEADRPVCKEALDLFLKAQRSYPKALGPYRNAAFVAKSLGLVALAARNFRQVARNAPLESTEARRRWAEPAHKEAEALEPRIPYVTVTMKNASSDEVSLKLDGEPLGAHLLGTPVAVDPGAHEIVGETKDGRRVAVKITVAEKEKRDVLLPFDKKPDPKPKALPPDEPAGAPPPADTTSKGHVSASPAPKLLVAGGGVLTGAGLVFGVLAKSAKDSCRGGVCDSQADVDRAKSRATVSTVLVGIGLAAAAGGALWWSLDKPDKETQAALGFSPGLTGASLSLRVSR